MEYQTKIKKISINIFLISSVTSSNIISEICERIGANWKDISNALKSDKRIGKYAYLRPGLGLSGGNLERDLETLNHLIITFLKIKILLMWGVEEEDTPMP